MIENNLIELYNIDAHKVTKRLVVCDPCLLEAHHHWIKGGIVFQMLKMGVDQPCCYGNICKETQCPTEKK